MVHEQRVPEGARAAAGGVQQQLPPVRPESQHRRGERDRLAACAGDQYDPARRRASVGADPAGGAFAIAAEAQGGSYRDTHPVSGIASAYAPPDAPITILSGRAASWACIDRVATVTSASSVPSAAKAGVNRSRARVSTAKR